MCIRDSSWEFSIGLLQLSKGEESQFSPPCSNPFRPMFVRGLQTLNLCHVLASGVPCLASVRFPAFRGPNASEGRGSMH
eukprot:4021032-Prymnesium_polylepis.1